MSEWIIDGFTALCVMVLMVAYARERLRRARQDSANHECAGLFARYFVDNYISCMTEDAGPEPRDGFGGLYCRMCKAKARGEARAGGLHHTSDCLVGKAEELLDSRLTKRNSP